MTDPIYISPSLYAKLFGSLPCRSNLTTVCGKTSLIVRPIRTYPKGLIVVDIETDNRKAKGAEEKTMLFSSSELTKLPFYENGDLLLDDYLDLELVRNEIPSDEALLGAMFRKTTAGRRISDLLREKGLTTRAGRIQLAKAAAETFTDTARGVGYAKFEKRQEWHDKSCAEKNGWNKSWKRGVLNCLRHYIAEQLDDSGTRIGNGTASDSSTYPHDEYNRVWNAIAQMHPRLPPEQLSELKKRNSEKAKASRERLSSLGLPVDLVPKYLGDLSVEKKEKLNKESFDQDKQQGRRSSPPLPCYYTQKANKLESGALTKVRQCLENTLVGDGIDAPEQIAVQMMVVCFDHFMHGANITKHGSKTFRDYAPLSRAEIVEQLPKLHQLAMEDKQIANRVLGCELFFEDGTGYVEANVDGNQPMDVEAEIDHRELLERRLRRAGLNPFEEYVFRELHELPISLELSQVADDFEKLTDEKKLEWREDVDKKVMNAPVQNRYAGR